METILPGLDATANSHPLFVHLPLALWPVALLFLVIGVSRGNEHTIHAGRLLLYLATISAIAAATSGWLAANSMGHDSPGHDVVHVHRNWMFVATVLSLVTSAMAFFVRRSLRPLASWGVIVFLTVTLATATLGADRGALLVFKHGMGTSIQPSQEQGHDSSNGQGRHQH